MIRVLLALSIALGFSAPTHASPLFGTTHMAPSPLTLPAGRLVYGTEIAFGVTDFLQIGTNLLRDIFRIFNANAKLSLIDTPVFALSPTFGVETYNYRDLSDSNPDLRVTALMPGAVAALAVTDPLAWFAYGNLNFTQTSLLTEGVTKSGFYRGVFVGSDLAWAYNSQAPEAGRERSAETRRRPKLGNVLAVGATYDLSYKIAGIGVSHHWSGFRVGVHYYPNAGKHSIQPIITGGGVVDL